VRSGALPLLTSSISESSLDTRRPAETDSKNLGCRGFPCRAFLGHRRETLKRACRTLPRSEASAHLCKLRLRAVRASPRHLMPPFPLATIRQSAGPGAAVAEAGTGTVGSGAGAATGGLPSGEGPAPQAWDGNGGA